MFDIKGLTELQAGVRAMAVTLRPQIQEAVVEVMEPETSKIQKDCPVKTGKLKRSIKFSRGKGKGELARIDISAPYAGFVEWGSRGRRGRNFVTPHVNTIKSKLSRRN